MTGLDLAWIVNFLSDLVSSGLKDRLKPKSATENARKAAFALYEALRELSDASDAFIRALKETSADRGKTSSLVASVDPVRRALRGVESALRKIAPQLSVYAPDIDHEIETGIAYRDYHVQQAEDAIQEIVHRGDADLGAIAESAARTGVEIHAAVEKLRQFLADQFSFKESFPGG